MKVKKRRLEINLERLSGDTAMPRPLRIKIDITIPTNDPRQETVWEPFAALVSAMLDEGEAEELLRRFRETYPSFAPSIDALEGV